MADLRASENYSLDLDTSGSTVLVEAHAVGLGASGGPIAQGGTAETTINVAGVGGGTAHDAVDSGNPIKIGGAAATSLPTAVAAGDRVNAWFSLNGALNVILRDAAGAAVTTGVQYAEDAGLGTTPTGTLVMARRTDTLATLTPIVDDAASVRVNSRGALWVIPDTNLMATPADAAASASGQIGTNQILGFGGTNWDRLRTIESPSAAPNVDSGILAVGTGPGWDRKRDPANLATAANSAITQIVNGANFYRFYVGTTTTGTLTFEVSADDAAWVGAEFWEEPVGFPLTGTNPTPTSGKVYLVTTAGWRQVRVRTVTTLGATTVIKYTGHAGPSMDRLAAPHSIPYAIITKTAQYTGTQTGVALWTPASGKRIVVTYVDIGVGGTTAGTMQLWFGASGDTTYSRGTDKAVFDHEFAPSATLKPGVIIGNGAGPIGVGAVDDILRVTDSAAINPLTVTVWGYEV